MNQTPSEPTEQGHISRRAVNKGIAWGAPVVAAAVAAPAIAASGQQNFRARVEVAGDTRNSAEGSFELPADATNVTFVVHGAGGGGGTYSTGGAGNHISGPLSVVGAHTIRLVAGAGGGTPGAAALGGEVAGGQGFGSGGTSPNVPTSLAHVDGFQDQARGGGGGGASALLVDDEAKVIAGAGGGGGSLGAVWYPTTITYDDGPGDPNGGDAGADGGYPKQRLLQAESPSPFAVNQPSGSATVNGFGKGAVGATPGDASDAFTWVAGNTAAGTFNNTNPVSSAGDINQQTAGGAGVAGDLAYAGTRGDGGDGVARYDTNGNIATGDLGDDGFPASLTSAQPASTSGGGGGGYAGGGAGGSYRSWSYGYGWNTMPGANQWSKAEYIVGGSGGGGGGSSYIDATAVGTSSAVESSAGNGGAAQTSGGGGYVEVYFTSSTFTPGGIVSVVP